MQRVQVSRSVSRVLGMSNRVFTCVSEFTFALCCLCSDRSSFEKQDLHTAFQEPLPTPSGEVTTTIRPHTQGLAFTHSRIHAVTHGAGVPPDATPSRKRKASAEEPPREMVPPPAVPPPTSEEKRVASTLKARERRAKLKKEREVAPVPAPVPHRQPAAPPSCEPARSAPGEWRRRSTCAASRQ